MKTTPKERAEVIHRLGSLGIDYQSAEQLRRISMTLHRWSELECGDGNDYSSWSIERDETTGKPFLCVYPHTGKSYRRPVADREAGAKKRLAKIMANFPGLLPYIQGDPRGASLYILKADDVHGYNIDSVYTRGTAVY